MLHFPVYYFCHHFFLRAGPQKFKQKKSILVKMGCLISSTKLLPTSLNDSIGEPFINDKGNSGRQEDDIFL